MNETNSQNGASPILPPDLPSLRKSIYEQNTRGWMRDFPEVMSDLSAPIPLKLVSFKPLYKISPDRTQKLIGRAPYLRSSTISLILDYITPGWGKLDEVTASSDMVIVKTKIQILCAQGLFEREGLGSEPTSSTKWGGPIPKAAAQAMRRAVALFGLGRCYWDSETARATVASYQKKFGLPPLEELGKEAF
ncbi:MAG: hypothetical protein F6K26_25260 [Moorea sp. SIO2I5]|nr:hypothetical protein [Moorena sp. SIO2I5]